MQNDISEKKGIELVRSVLKWLAIALSVLGVWYLYQHQYGTKELRDLASAGIFFVSALFALMARRLLEVESDASGYN